MELRVLQYFLTICREENILGAAQSLHLSQPTLSRQLKDLEAELGKQLFIRGNRKITLTEEGMILRKRAEEIIQLVQKTEDEISLPDKTIAGNIYIGAGETDGVRFIAKAQQTIRKDYPLVRFHMESGDSVTTVERLDKGLLDFALVFGKVDSSKYASLKIPYLDTWGVLMRRDSPLAEKKSVQPEDLWDKPLLISRQEYTKKTLFPWLKQDREQLNIIGTYNLLFNASIMVEEGLGYALGLDRIINVSGNSRLCFRPLFPRVQSDTHIIWKKHQALTKHAEKFLKQLKISVSE
ncbi:MAG: LysR family transcriptional regulator [Anaerovoracaceae bacterium]